MDNLHNYGRMNITNDDGLLTCTSTNFGQIEDELDNSCYCEREGVFRVHLPLEDEIMTVTNITEEQTNATTGEVTTVVTVNVTTNSSRNQSISGTDILAINVDSSFLTSAPFKTCTDGSKVEITLLGEDKKPIVNHDFVSYNDSTRALTIVTTDKEYLFKD